MAQWSKTFAQSPDYIPSTHIKAEHNNVYCNPSTEKAETRGSPDNQASQYDKLQVRQDSGSKNKGSN